MLSDYEQDNPAEHDTSPAPTPSQPERPTDSARSYEQHDAAAEGSNRGDDGTAPDHVPARFAAIADDQQHKVDPHYIPAERVSWWIFLAFVSFPSFIFVILAWLFGWFGQPVTSITSIAWVVVTLLILLFTLRWPQLTYKYTRYCVSGVGIEIRKGVVWRGIHNVPRNRVQHTDVRQGPLERRFGIATLTIFTAGTADSSVQLSGIAHERALMIRDYLIASEEDDDGV